ncbi:Fc.00g078610.m01.CDS01 [Cosmosporella sp. VM-42]
MRRRSDSIPRPGLRARRAKKVSVSARFTVNEPHQGESVALVPPLTGPVVFLSPPNIPRLPILRNPDLNPAYQPKHDLPFAVSMSVSKYRWTAVTTSARSTCKSGRIGILPALSTHASSGSDQFNITSPLHFHTFSTISWTISKYLPDLAVTTHNFLLIPCDIDLRILFLQSVSWIHSILSPSEPETDDLSGVSSNQSTPKRKFEEAFSPPEATSVAPPRPESIDSRHPRSEGSGAESAKGNVDELRTPIIAGSQDGKKSARMRPPMRSSIACLRCRRSKIKCDNDGGNSPCETCIKAGHKCQYPEAPLPPKRNDPPAGGRQEREGMHERKRAKKADDVPGFDSEKSAAYAEEVLSYPFLTGDVWDQVLGIYRLHFATELPFVHLPTLKEKMSRRHGKDADPSSELNLVLLGILTLTARFHPDLVKYVAHMSTSHGGNTRPRTSQSKIDPSAASEFFANALTTALGPLKTAMTAVSVERVQAFLMLGLYEWSQRYPYSGSGAWIYVGVAIRLAQILRLGLDDKISKSQDNTAQGPRLLSGSSRGSSEIGITKEIRRRTMFSCLILDRLLACGNERVSSLRSEDLRIQLPCSEMAFDLALDVHTGFLTPFQEERSRPINDDSVLGRFIRLVDIWGSISRYSSTGGRVWERVPPWDERSTFMKLKGEFRRFMLDLPDTFTLSRSNYYRHDNHQATNMYVSLHMLASLCQIVLEREYLPFLPIRCGAPQGPLDPRMVLLTEVPDGFWEESAGNIFGAARDIIDIVEICREKLPQSSLTLFTVWTAAFVGIYAAHFPHMDRRNQILNQEDVGRGAGEDFDITQGGATGVAYQALHKMTACLQGADNYLRQFHEMDRYFTRAKSEFHLYTGKGKSAAEGPAERRLSIRLGEEKGVLESENPRGIQVSKERTIVPEDRQRLYQPESFDESRGSTTERSSSMGISEGYPPRLTPSMAFKAINNPSSLSTAPVEPLPSILEPQRESFPSTERRDSTRTTSSQLELPGHYPDDPPMGIVEFSMDQFSFLESQRIGKILNDLQEFSGAGSFGGLSWNDLDAEERPYSGLRSG